MGQLGQFGAPDRGICHIIKRFKYSNRTVTLIQQSGRYSVDNYTGINCLNCSQIQFQRYNSQKFPAIREFLYVITAEMAPKFNLRGLLLKIFQQLEKYVAIKYKLAEITLKFNLRWSNSQKFLVIRNVYNH